MASIVLTAATAGGTTSITPTDQSGVVNLTLPSTGGTLQTSGAGFTTNGVAYATSTSALATGGSFTFNGSATSPVVTVTSTSTTASSQDFTTNSAAQRATIGVERSAGAGLFVGSSAYAAVFGSAGASSTQFASNNNVRMTIDSSGLVGIGTSSPAYGLDVQGSSNTSIRVYSPNYSSLRVQNSYTGTSNSDGLLIEMGYTDALIYNYESANLKFGTNNTEAMRIDASQHLLLGNTAPTVAVAEYKMYLQGPANAANSNSTALADQKCGLYLYDNNAGNSNTEGAQSALVIAVSQGGASTPGNLITGYTTYSTPLRTFQVTAYGAVYNNNGTYGTLSDQKAKQDIVDASSQWQDIKNVRVRKYRLKSEVERNENAPSLIGVVAQELELTSPNLVDSPEGCETDENVFKTVKTSVLQMKALKALQEAMARIETLETTITSLTERITALEGK